MIKMFLDFRKQKYNRMVPAKKEFISMTHKLKRRFRKIILKIIFNLMYKRECERKLKVKLRFKEQNLG